MKRLLVFFLAALITNISHAQYRCAVNGKAVFQDHPCANRTGTESAQHTSPKARTSSESPIEAGKTLCTTEAAKHLAWKDPGSVTVGNVYGGKMEVIKIGSSPVGARAYSVQVNAKNSYGGYVGEKPILCYTSEDGRRILQINAALVK